MRQTCNFENNTIHPTGSFLTGQTAPEAVLYNNGPLITHAGGGAGGAHASAVQTARGLSTYGFGQQLSAGLRLADDFVVNAASGWCVATITFYAYQTGSTTSSTINHVNLRIWNGPPNSTSSQVVFGDNTTNRMISTGWSIIYRVLDTGLTDTQRPIMADVVRVNTLLPAGTYWLDWQTGGSGSYTGPWVPPISILGQTTTGNALQYDSSWLQVIDDGTSTAQGFPFIIQGTLALDAPSVVLQPAASVHNDPVTASGLTTKGTPLKNKCSAANKYAKETVENAADMEECLLP